MSRNRNRKPRQEALPRSAACPSCGAALDPSHPLLAAPVPEAGPAPVSEVPPPGPARTPARPEGPAPEPAREAAADRIPTYVSGFDEALGGGIPEGSVVVVAGSPGTMKSSLALSILLNHARAGTRGLYVTLDEGGHSLLRQAVALGLDTTAIPHDVRLLDFGPQGPDRDWLASFRTQVEAVHADRGDRLLVLDSLEGLEARAGLVDRRRDLFKLFDWMRSLGTTTFLLAERPDVFVRNAVVFGRYDEDYLADGVLHLRLHVGEDATVQRRLRCVKLRRAAHDPSYFALLFDGGRFHATKSLRGS